MTQDAARPRPVWLLGLIGLLAGLLIAALLALGVWQVQRMGWKLDLIARVEMRLAATPVVAPGPAAWAGITAARDEYARITVSGRFDHRHEVLVQAVTAEGGGFWVMTPLYTPEGWALLVNRGFVPAEKRDPASRGGDGGGTQPEGTVTLTGLLRLTEPGGGFLRENDPAAGRWYSRDVAAIAAATGVADAAPYFMDAAAGPDPAALPMGGLTVVAFRNHHLSYALTWFALAALVTAAAAWLGYYEWQLRRDHARLAGQGAA